MYHFSSVTLWNKNKSQLSTHKTYEGEEEDSMPFRNFRNSQRLWRPTDTP